MPTDPSSAASTASPSPLFLTTPSRRRWPRRVVAVAVAGLVAGATVAVVVTRSSGPSGYRTAAVATQDLAQRLTSVGAVEPVDRAAVAFPVTGTVAAVDVAVGDAVTTGQTLASLDPTSLDMDVRRQQAALDQAELALQRALDGESVASPGSGGSSGAPASASQTAATTLDTDAPNAVLLAADVGPTTTSDTGSTGPTDEELRAAQQAVLDAQQAVDAKLGTAQQALDSAALVCAAATSPGPGSGTTTTTPATTTPATTTPGTDPVTTTTEPATTVPDTTTTDPAPTTTTPAATTAPAPTTVASTTVAAAQASAQLVGIVFTAASSQGSITACQRQLEVVLGAEQDVSAAQNALATAATNLDDLLDRRMEAVTTPSTTEPPSTDVPGSDVAGQGGPQAQGGQRPSGIAGGGGSSGGSVSASPSSADLIAYQRDVDAAQASLLVAQQALKQAAIASPIDGHIVAVDLAVGDAVTAGSTTATIVVAGDGGYEVTTTVAVADLPKVEVGQQADVVIDGSSTALDGTVVAIGVAATSTTGATTYPVSISLPAGTEVLDGSVASVAVVTSSAHDALAVPTSAMHTNGSRHTVDVLEDGELTEVAVGVGTVGDTWTEITSGLTTGQVVVLADLGEALPGSATESSTNGGQNGPVGGFGGPGGQGGPPAFPGGGQGGPPGGR